MKNNDEKQNALFIQRLLAYLIDIMIVSFISTLLSYPFYDNSSVEKLNNSSMEIVEKYIDKEISAQTYIVESMDISYQIAKKTGAVSLITLFLCVLYFICFQFYKKGQTIGKYLMRIKIVSNDDSQLNINNYIYRSLIINSILVDIIVLCFVIFTNSEIYFYGTATFEMIKYAIIVVSALMVMFRKDSRGLHDIIADTKVVRVDTVKELEICEN